MTHNNRYQHWGKPELQFKATELRHRIALLESEESATLDSDMLLDLVAEISELRDQLDDINEVLEWRDA